MTNEAYEVPDDNVLVKLFQDGKLSIGKEMKQFVCDLSKQSMAMESADTDTSAQLTECQQPMEAQLVPNLRSAIGKLTTAINGGIEVSNSELEAVQNLLHHSLFLLADWWQIPRDELVPKGKKTNANEQPQTQNALKELAKIWNENKHQNWQNDQKTHNNYKSENGKNEKRMLQLMLELSNFGSSELADERKSVKKSQRRRKKRNLNNVSIAVIIAGCLIVVVLIFAACQSRGSNAPAASSVAAKMSSWIGIRNVPMSSGRAPGHNIPPSYNVPAPPPPEREEGCNIQ
ncbi:hypothetical protein niasHT_006228 [Heterodera trifolii]|uniref:Uncharacterized protein n=1 Tax=Heterodera trifolii TaxID=157864 RepID=A0ABD2M164_9BILA